MQILYIDLGQNEDLSILPKRYGGIRMVPAWLKQFLPNFVIAGKKECFDSFCSQDKASNIIEIDDRVVQALLAGENTFDVLGNGFHILFHTVTNSFISTKANQLVWAPGQNEAINQSHSHLALHSSHQNPILHGNPTIHPIVLGAPIPEFFIEHRKQAQIFQCSNHYQGIQSIVLADLCNRIGYKCLFAGKIQPGYPLLEHIDNKNTFWLGEISEEDKINYLKESAFSSALYSYTLNTDSLATKLALGYGCGILTTQAGNVEGTVGVGNGFVVKDEWELLDAINNVHRIDQKKCWHSVQKYSISNMVDSFNKAFLNIHETRSNL